MTKDQIRARLRASGYARDIVTNQSVIGRGLVTEEGLARVHEEMLTRLARSGDIALYRWPQIGFAHQLQWKGHPRLLARGSENSWCRAIHTRR